MHGAVATGLEHDRLEPGIRASPHDVVDVRLGLELPTADPDALAHRGKRGRPIDASRHDRQDHEGWNQPQKDALPSDVHRD